MTVEEKERRRLTAMCERVEYVFDWSPGTLRGKSYLNEVTRLRNQVILDAFDRKMGAKHLASFFGRTPQSIYASIKKAEEDREFQKKYTEVQGWLCDV